MEGALEKGREEAQMSDNAVIAICTVSICSVFILPILFNGAVNVIHAWRVTSHHVNREKGTEDERETNPTDDND